MYDAKEGFKDLWGREDESQKGRFPIGNFLLLIFVVYVVLDLIRAVWK
jgi:hypothetical protein